MRIHFGTDQEGPFTALSEKGRVLVAVRGIDPLKALDEALASVSRTLDDAKAVAVHAGPSGFSDVRRRVSAANGIAFALQLPVVATTEGAEAVAKISDADYLKAPAFAGAARFVMPLYERAPNITKSKKLPPLWNSAR